MDFNSSSDALPASHVFRRDQSTSLLRLGVIFLALVSFFTTANGMREYIFKESGTVAYGASAAIQSILLALSMNLPKYLQGIWNANKQESKVKKWGWQETRRLALCVIAVLLTIVTLFCSSWFSYVYIADVIHKDSWDTDSELLVQQTYRQELYDARDYAHIYRTYLEERVGEDILYLEQQAREIKDSNPNTVPDWGEEAATFASDGGTAASYMSPVIRAMENALREGATQENRDLAVTAVGDAKRNISERIETVQGNLERINTNLVNYGAQIANITNRINNATEETDIASLNNSINSLTRLINSETQRQIDLQQETAQLDNALLRLPLYESLLGLNSSTSAISIRNQLIQMQSEFFKPEPDDKVLLDTATDIFDNLREAANTVAGGEDGADSNEYTYTSLLVQMNRLIRNLTDYSGIKNTEANLDELIDSLQVISEKDSDQDPEQDPEQTPEQDTGQDPEQDTEQKERSWQKKWRDRLEDLKAQVSAMPVYSGTEETEGIHILTDSQMNILRSYDRNTASKALDEMIRRYLSEHNAIYQGIIYLRSPYKMLAIFALCLAFSFDLSGFVFGVIMQGEPQKEDEENKDEEFAREEAARDITGIPDRTKNRSGRTEWSILDHRHQYRVLTGDFSRRNGVYYYKVFRDGVAEQWAVEEDAGIPYKQGIYILGEETTDIEQETGDALTVDIAREINTEQALFYSGQGKGPMDGVFINCNLVYEEGGLSKENPDGTLSFICSLEEYVPVHCYSPAERENRTFPVKCIAEKEELNAKVVVIALNKTGTRVSAIYIIKNN